MTSMYRGCSVKHVDAKFSVIFIDDIGSHQVDCEGIAVSIFNTLWCRNRILFIYSVLTDYECSDTIVRPVTSSHLAWQLTLHHYYYHDHLYRLILIFCLTHCRFLKFSETCM